MCPATKPEIEEEDQAYRVARPSITVASPFCHHRHHARLRRAGWGLGRGDPSPVGRNPNPIRIRKSLADPHAGAPPAASGSRGSGRPGR